MSPRMWRTFGALGFSPRPVLGPPLSCADWLPLTWVQSVWPQRQPKAEWGWGRHGGGGREFRYLDSNWLLRVKVVRTRSIRRAEAACTVCLALPGSPGHCHLLVLHLCLCCVSVHDKQMFICFLFSFSGLLLMGMLEFCLIKDQLVLLLWLN